MLNHYAHSERRYSRLLLALTLIVVSIMMPAQAMAAPAEQESAGDIVETAIAAGSFSTLVAAVDAAGLVETLQGEGPFTVFAPTDAAFAALPAGTVEQLLQDPTGALKDILLYHVTAGEVGAVDVLNSIGKTVNMVNGQPLAISVSGHRVVVGSAGFVATDIQTSNGVIHVIDSVLLPPRAPAAAAPAPAPAPAPSTLPNIVETAVSAGSFSTLVAAVQAAGLVETLQGEGPFTVFAPTDDAFAALPAGTVEALLADPSGALTDILLYHVLSGKVLAADVVGLDNTAVTTANGNYFVVRLADGGVKINDATVVTTDIETSNGVIHVIDTVLIPPAETAASQPAPSTGCGTAHHVRHGETLAGIATHYGVSMHTLVQNNNIHNANRIYVGQRICIGH